MFCNVLSVEMVLFSALPGNHLFLIVNKDERGNYHLDRHIYRKSVWGSSNAVRENYDDKLYNQGGVSIEKDQIVFPLV